MTFEPPTGHILESKAAAARRPALGLFAPITAMVGQAEAQWEVVNRCAVVVRVRLSSAPARQAEL
jgi:hypothetical protein